MQFLKVDKSRLKSTNELIRWAFSIKLNIGDYDQ